MLRSDHHLLYVQYMPDKNDIPDIHILKPSTDPEPVQHVKAMSHDLYVRYGILYNHV